MADSPSASLPPAHGHLQGAELMDAPPPDLTLTEPVAVVAPDAGARLAAAHNAHLGQRGLISAEHGSAADARWHPEFLDFFAAYPRAHRARIVQSVGDVPLDPQEAQEHVARVAEHWTGPHAANLEFRAWHTERLRRVLISVVEEAVTYEVEIAGWLASALGEVAEALPGREHDLLAQRPGSWEADLVERLVFGTIGPADRGA